MEKGKEEEAPREAALRSLLKEAHDLFVLFYGSVRALLNAHPAGDTARSCLYAFFPDYIAGLLFSASMLEDARRSCLKALLHAHPAADAARSCLYAFFPGFIAGLLSSTSMLDNNRRSLCALSIIRACFVEKMHVFIGAWSADFGTGKKLRLPSVADSLTERRFVQFFLPKRETLLEALVSNVLVLSNVVTHRVCSSTFWWRAWTVAKQLSSRFGGMATFSL